MTAGLFYVYTDPGTVDETEFHDWYDHEHGPARLTVPGFGPAYRYRALDELKPPWLALYELDRPDVVESPEYQALGANASDRDKAVAAGLATLDRRVYEQISEDGYAVAAASARPCRPVMRCAGGHPSACPKAGPEDPDRAAVVRPEEHMPDAAREQRARAGGAIRSDWLAASPGQGLLGRHPNRQAGLLAAADDAGRAGRFLSSDTGLAGRPAARPGRTPGSLARSAPPTRRQAARPLSGPASADGGERGAVLGVPTRIGRRNGVPSTRGPAAPGQGARQLRHNGLTTICN